MEATPPPAAIDDSSVPFSIWRIARLSSFQVGSAMAEILTASVWNRVMISDLNMPATPVGLLLALQYLLLPISLWAGHRSDSMPLWGKQRTSYIWLGRLLMLIAFPLLGYSTRAIGAGSLAIGWTLATVTFLLFGVGKLLSGSVYLALVRDSAPPSRRGQAIGIAETTLIAFFPIVAVAYGRWMEQYEPARFWQMIVGTTLLAAFFWWASIVRSERHKGTAVRRLPRTNFRKTLNQIWHDRRTRQFFYFLALATFMAWMQDNVLEPFGGDVFDLPAGVTTRFTGYWGGATVVVLLLCFVALRRGLPERQSNVTTLGLALMGVGMGLLAWTSYTEAVGLLTPTLLIFGAGFGAYTFGGLSLMAVMSPAPFAGAYLGLWTACILLSKGVGTFVGGLLRDIFIRLGGLTAGDSYALIFGVAAAGLLLSSVLVQRIDFVSFAREHEPHQR